MKANRPRTTGIRVLLTLWMQDSTRVKASASLAAEDSALLLQGSRSKGTFEMAASMRAALPAFRHLPVFSSCAMASGNMS